MRVGPEIAAAQTFSRLLQFPDHFLEALRLSASQGRARTPLRRSPISTAAVLPPQERSALAFVWIPMARVPMTHAQDDISQGGAGSG